jgi:hypothetical protein
VGVPFPPDIWIAMDPADYPFAQPDSSQLVLAERVLPVVAVREGRSIAKWTVRDGDQLVALDDLLGSQYTATLAAKRWPVIAYGSNSNADVLRDKLSGIGPTFVPMLRAQLRDVDVVYSAHVSPKGAIPATLCPSPDTRLTVFVLLLEINQLVAMDETEPNYDRMLVTKPGVLMPDLAAAAQAYVYKSKHGLLNIDGEPRRVAPIPAAARRFQTVTEPDVLEIARQRLGVAPGGSAEAAEAQTATLKRDALPAELPFVPTGSQPIVGRTAHAMREEAAHNYVIAVSPQRKQDLGLGRYAVLTFDACDRALGMRRLAALGRVVTVPQRDLDGCEVAADQSLRSAVGVPYETGAAGMHRVELHPVKGRLRPGRRDRWLVRWLGWRYLLMRVVPADVPDMEKRFARIHDDAFRLLGSATGDRLRVESVVCKEGSYELEDRGIRAYTLNETTVERRRKNAEPYIGARYPDPEATLGVTPDIFPIYLDASDRARLGVEPLDPVAVRPDLLHLLAREVREVGLAFFLSGFAIYSIWESWLVAPIAALLAMALALMNIRARVGT